ncbi:MAG: sulfotransferase [Desulfocapsaceae bacterium]|nr:sulfotransferase [Desulfocapsaceae bacterium]
MSIKEMPIIVGGFYRSGTSLIRRLLDAHSRIHCGPEVKFFKDLRGDYLNDPLAHVRLFSTLPSLGLEPDEIRDIFGRAFIEAHELAARKAGKARWADKNPENLLYLDQWQHLLPGGFVFVHVVRHPLDVLASLLEIGFAKAVPAIFEDKVKFLKTFVDEGLRYEKLYPETSFRIRYEELVTAPTATLKSLFNWLGEDFEAQVLNNFSHAERGRGIEDPKVVTTDRVHNRSVGRWQTDLTSEQIEIALAILGVSFSSYKI